MVNRQRKILKYIYKHPRSTHSTLIRKFPDFTDYMGISLEYLIIQDEYVDAEQAWEQKLSAEASKEHLSIPETQEYIQSNMPKDKLISVADPDDHKFYSTNLAFQEYSEKRRHEAVLFWVPYTITTVIAVAPLVPKIINYICRIFSSGICP